MMATSNAMLKPAHWSRRIFICCETRRSCNPGQSVCCTEKIIGRDERVHLVAFALSSPFVVFVGRDRSLRVEMREMFQGWDGKGASSPEDVSCSHRSGWLEGTRASVEAAFTRDSGFTVDFRAVVTRVTSAWSQVSYLPACAHHPDPNSVIWASQVTAKVLPSNSSELPGRVMSNVESQSFSAGVLKMEARGRATRTSPMGRLLKARCARRLYQYVARLRRRD
jgi:hypothetical protein